MAPVSVVDGGTASALVDRAAETAVLTGDIDDVLLEELRASVLRGMAFLDEWKPGWVNLIDLGTLDLSYCFACVWGQLEGDFWQAMPLIGRGIDNGTGVVQVDWDWTTLHGFTRPEYETYDALTQVWREQIALRRLLDVTETIAVQTFDDEVVTVSDLVDA